MTTAQRIEQYILNEIMVSDRGKRLSHDTPLLESGILDSLSLLRLIDFIQEDFGVEIDPEEIVADNFQTINVVVKLVESKG